MEEQRENGKPSESEEQMNSTSEPEEKHSDLEEVARTDFSDPVYKEISLANGTINRMNRDELRAKCAELKLDTRGVKDVLKKRLKNYYKRQKLRQSGASGQPDETYYDYICVVDFEATCEENNPRNYVHEIIEFPMVLIDTRSMEITDSFQEYVQPEVNPLLSDFCVKLTGITQKIVDEADTFSRVLRRAVAWLQEKELGTKYKYTLLTDGSWDMSKFLYTQCRLSRLRFPQFARSWINIRKTYGNYYKVDRTQTRLNCMLENMGLQYEGRPHCGLDDSRNIARVAVHMLKDGCQLRANERLHANELQNVPVSALLALAAPPQYPKIRD
ncbi:3'-5' exoribonuclease 1 [Trichomycterus rosablanca]|uniref:3'-5' exoribonuclease 1 n=1 Tax=Trichomycterus rosablanca TaxID=2290929 RepID=UPI002F357629